MMSLAHARRHKPQQMHMPVSTRNSAIQSLLTALFGTGAASRIRELRCFQQFCFVVPHDIKVSKNFFNSRKVLPDVSRQSRKKSE
jgi:hypothetical protein